MLELELAIPKGHLDIEIRSEVFENGASETVEVDGLQCLGEFGRSIKSQAGTMDCDSDQVVSTTNPSLALKVNRKTKLPNEILQAIFDTVTISGFWQARLALLHDQNLRCYSTTRTHLKVLMSRRHLSGCHYFTQFIERTIPVTLEKVVKKEGLLKIGRKRTVEEKWEQIAKHMPMCRWCGCHFWSCSVM